MAITKERMDEIRKAVEGLSKEEQQAKLDEILSDEEREELFGQQQCPFCLIASGDIPARKVYEDDLCMAVLDINPANNGHTILFTKKHYPLMTMLEDSETAHLFTIANHLCKVVFESLGSKGTNLHVANGGAAGQNSPHALINIIPRTENDGIVFGWKPKKLSDEEMDNLSKKISGDAKSIGPKKKQPEIIKPAVIKRDNLKIKPRIP